MMASLLTYNPLQDYVHLKAAQSILLQNLQFEPSVKVLDLNQLEKYRSLVFTQALLKLS